MTNHITSLKIYQSLIMAHHLLSLCTDSKACSCVVFLSPSDNPREILQKWIIRGAIRREIGEQQW